MFMCLYTVFPVNCTIYTVHSQLFSAERATIKLKRLGGKLGVGVVVNREQFAALFIIYKLSKLKAQNWYFVYSQFKHPPFARNLTELQKKANWILLTRNRTCECATGLKVNKSTLLTTSNSINYSRVKATQILRSMWSMEFAKYNTHFSVPRQQALQTFH